MLKALGIWNYIAENAEPAANTVMKMMRGIIRRIILSFSRLVDHTLKMIIAQSRLK